MIKLVSSSILFELQVIINLSFVQNDQSVYNADNGSDCDSTIDPKRVFESI